MDASIEDISTVGRDADEMKDLATTRTTPRTASPTAGVLSVVLGGNAINCVEPFETYCRTVLKCRSRRPARFRRACQQSVREHASRVSVSVYVVWEER
jgi:hypothetical protein